MTTLICRVWRAHAAVWIRRGSRRRLVARLRPQWVPPAEQPAEQVDAAAQDKHEGRRAQRTRERHAAIHALADKGVSVGRIAVELQLDPKTVRRFARAASPEELIDANPTGRASSLDGHAAYLAARWAEGCTSTSRLHQGGPRPRYIRKRAHRRRFLHRLRENTDDGDAEAHREAARLTTAPGSRPPAPLVSVNEPVSTACA